MIKDYSISKIYLFIPVLVFILLNLLSAYYITSKNVYNGDFLGIPLKQSHSQVWLYSIYASLPYIFLYYIVLKVKPLSRHPLEIPKQFVLFSYFLLITSLILTIVYGVGMMAQEIYSVPSLIKPLVVLINRIEPLSLVCILLLSPYVKWRTAIFLSTMLFTVFIFRGSLSALPILFIVFFFRFLSHSNNNKKFFSVRSSWIYISFCFITLLVIYYAPILYEIREGVRGINISSESQPMYDFIFGKLIGRLSNLSALLVFEFRYQLFYEKIDDLQYFSYFYDSVKYIWGSFIKSPVMNHYDFFTSINDHYAVGFYAMQTGTIPALSISMMKSPAILLIDLTLTILCIYLVVKLSTFFLGEYGKYLSITLLILPVLSGAPNQFSAPIFNLIVISVIYILIKYFSSLHFLIKK